MIFWAIVGVLLLATVLALLAPLIRRRVETGSRPDHELAVLKDQLREIEADLAAGRMDEAQAAAGRIEVERRILAEAAALETESAANPVDPDTVARRRLIASTLVILLVPIGTMAMYMILGTPGMPDVPLAERAAERARLAETADRRQGLSEMAAELAERLKSEPSDLAGWMLLGRTYQMLEQPKDAVEAFAKATQLPTADAQTWSSFGEALVQGNDGLVTPVAREAFSRAVDLMPAEPRARFYLGLAERQAGDPEGALGWWVDLEADSPADAPWQGLLRQRIEEAAEVAGIDLADRRSQAAERSVKRENGRGPSAEDMEEAARMAPQDRLAMIEGMVEGLAARLAEDPSDVEGWRRLGRSYKVLEQPEKAVEAFGEAARRAPDSVEAQLDYAHALFPPGTSERDMPQEFIDAVGRVRTIDPSNPEGLFFGGLIAARRGDGDEARTLWSELLKTLPVDSPVRAAVESRIQALDG